jgi:site-specific recombinase XerD
LGGDEIREFETHLLRDKKLAATTVEGRMSALRFLYKKTLKRRDIACDDLIFPKTPQKLPVVLSPEEVTRMIEAAPNLMHRTILMVLYATGLRRTEASLLKVTDVDSERMVIHVRQGKGSRDRDVPMPPKLLEALREYWRSKRPKVYLFPSTAGHRGGEQPISDHTIWYICSEAAKRAGIKKRIGAHTLRHSFATTLMESGTDLRTIQLLMGHVHLEQTTRYLHLSQRHLHAAANPLDQITVNGPTFSRKRSDDYQA